MSDEPDIWGKRSSDYAASAAGNALLRGARDSAASRRRPLAELTQSAVPVDAPTDAGQRLTAALAELERAKAAGDTDAAAYADHVVSTLLEQSRAGASQPRDEHGQFDRRSPAEPSGFDGGVRNRKRAPNPHLRREWEQDPNFLFRQAIAASHARSREASEGLRRENGITIANS